MANEIIISAITGITVDVQIYHGATPVGTAITTAEVGTTGQYIASMPGGTPYGYYLLVASAVGGDNPVIAGGDIFWDGQYEMPVGLYVTGGLDPNNPATTTQTELNAGAIAVTISGDQIDTTTLTRTS
jgi:hypothetical protein